MSEAVEEIGRWVVWRGDEDGGRGWWRGGGVGRVGVGAVGKDAKAGIGFKGDGREMPNGGRKGRMVTT